MEADESGEPQTVVLGRKRLAVAAVQDRWRIDDEWWRQQAVSRIYYTLRLEDGCLVTVHRDVESDKWAFQRP